ncbi:unnamed protein product [Heterobilharzia americana]|nr:unnamed protein product [Heterobilharzia americana]
MWSDGHIMHKQEIYFANKKNKIISLGQLLLIQDVIHNVVNKLGANIISPVTDFALFLTTKNSPADTCGNAPLYNDELVVHFRRICWTSPLELQKTPRAYLEFLFDQVVEEYLAGNWLPDKNSCDPDELYKKCLHLSCVLHLCQETSLSVSNFACELGNVTMNNNNSNNNNSDLLYLQVKTQS